MGFEQLLLARPEGGEGDQLPGDVLERHRVLERAGELAQQLAEIPRLEHDRSQPVAGLLRAPQDGEPAVDERPMNGLGDIDEARRPVRGDQRQPTGRSFLNQAPRKRLLVGVADLDQESRGVLLGEAADEAALCQAVVSGAEPSREHQLAAAQ
jgi:hypothetical protein